MWRFYHSDEGTESQKGMFKPVYNKKITPGCWCTSYKDRKPTNQLFQQRILKLAHASVNTKHSVSFIVLFHLFVFCRTCFCPGCDRWFPDKESTGTSTERGRENAIHPGGICRSSDEIQTTQHCGGNSAGLLWWARDSPRTYRYCPQRHLKVQRLLQDG